MIEGEPTNFTISDILGEPIPLKQTISEFVLCLSRENSLDDDTTEALQRFSSVELLARTLREDFRPDSRPELILYPVMGEDEEGNPRKTYINVTPDNYGEYVGIFSNTAFGIYTHDLQTESAREVAHQIQSFIQGILS